MRGVIGEIAPTFGSPNIDGTLEAQFPVICTQLKTLPKRRLMDDDHGLPAPGRIVLRRWIRVLTAVDLLGELGKTTPEDA